MQIFTSLSLLSYLAICMALPTVLCQAESAWSNVIFIAIEDFSAKHLGFYGGQAMTPHMDALARETVLFKNAFASFPVCNTSGKEISIHPKNHSS